MKTRLLIIIGLSVSLTIPFVYAIPELNHSQAFEYSDFVLIGKIVFVDIISEPTINENANRPGVAMYEIEIFEFKKNPDPESKKHPPKNSEFILVPGTFLREPHGMSYDTYPYEVGQIGIFYIQKNTHDYIDDELIIRSGVSKVDSEPEPPTISDEQQQMIQEYCETGIRHPDMVGIPQCIKNEPGCGPGPMFVDGICKVEPIRVDTIGSDGSPLPFAGGLVLVFGILGLVVYFVKRREEN